MEDSAPVTSSINPSPKHRTFFILRKRNKSRLIISNRDTAKDNIFYTINKRHCIDSHLQQRLPISK